MNRRSFRYIPLVLGLAACAPLDFPPTSPSPVATPARPHTAPERKTSAVLPRPPEPRPAPAVAGKPQPLPRLVGLSEAETAELLGPPSEETAAPPGKVWVYRAPACTLAVHLYPDLGEGGFRTLEVTAEGAAAEACLSKVAAPGRKG